MKFDDIIDNYFKAALALANSHMGRDSDTLLLKQKNDRKETEDFYMNVSDIICTGWSIWSDFDL